MFKLALTTAFLALSVLAQGPTIITPAAAVVCQPSKITWSGGKPNYWITVIPAGQVGAQPIETLVENSANTEYTWTVNLEAGTNISLQVRDGNGDVQYSSPIVIQSGSNSDCLNGTATSLAGAAGATGASQTQDGAGGAGGAGATSAGGASGSAGGEASATSGGNAASSGSAAASSAQSQASSAASAASSIASSARPTSAGAAGGASSAGGAGAATSGGAAAGSGGAPSAAASSAPASGGYVNAASLPAMGLAAVGAIAALL